MNGYAWNTRIPTKKDLSPRVIDIVAPIGKGAACADRFAAADWLKQCCFRTSRMPSRQTTRNAN